MNNFELHNPTKIVFGTDSMTKIADLVRPFGKKILVTYGGGSIKKNGIYDQVMSQLADFDIREFSGIEPNPRVETIRLAIAQFKEFQPDFILAVGGGSVIDGTKLLCASMNYSGDPWDFLINESTISPKYIPFGVVLTLSATGSEMNNGSVITNWTTHEKLFFGKDETYPIFSILDPQNTYTVPADQTAYGIIDAYSHVLEQYLHTTDNSPLQDRISQGILLTLVENAPIVLADPKNYIARANIMLSACLALNNLISSGVNQDWATHNIEHEISAFYDIPHAAGLAIITPHWMEVVKSTKLKKIAHYGREIWQLTGDDEAVATKAIAKTSEFFASLGVKMKLSEWQIDSTHFTDISERLGAKNIGEQPLSSDQILTILNHC